MQPDMARNPSYGKQERTERNKKSNHLPMHDCKSSEYQMVRSGVWLRSGVALRKIRKHPVEIGAAACFDAQCEKLGRVIAV